jgi:hypothetical protein
LWGYVRFYGAFGALRLGVRLDLVLAIGALALMLLATRLPADRSRRAASTAIREAAAAKSP